MSTAGTGTDAAADAAERVLRTMRNIGLGLLVASAFADAIEETVIGWRMRYAAAERKALRNLDSRSSRIASVAVAILEAGVPSKPAANLSDRVAR